MLSYIGGISVIPLVFLYLASYMFRFCEYHRMFLHYIVFTWIINITDDYVGIPIMYHTENGRKYSGEKFDMHKAKEVCERYRGILPTSATVADVYVAINSQYHDYAELFKNWFGDGIEQKIVESAIVFWFKDADCKAENKVVEYLGEY